MPSEVPNRCAARRCAAAVAALLLAALVAGPVAAAATHGARPASGAASAPEARPVDINSASKAQLKTLPGIGDAEADAIVRGRPYVSKAELVNRAVLPTASYLSIKRRIIAVQPPPARPAARQAAHP